MATDTLQTGVSQRNTRRWGLRRKRKLNTIIFFVTSHCNATCETCFYWDELNRNGDLSWDEIVRLSANTPPFTDLWFSGGEPTLRKELADIIDLFVENNGVSYINLPTNGLKPDRIYEVAEHCLTKNLDLELHINIALDGLREYHDFMRGVPGNFERALESARMLRTLKALFGLRLIVNINTVINHDNLDEIIPLAELVRGEQLADGHYFNLIRGNAKVPRLKSVERTKLRSIYSQLADIQWGYADGMFDDKNSMVKWFKKAFYVGMLTFHHRTQFANMEHPTRWPMSCTAGETSAVIDFDGRVRACELRQPIANLRDFDMNLNVLWETPARREEPAKIECDQCWCTHVCFIHDSLRYSYKTVLSEIPKNYLLRKGLVIMKPVRVPDLRSMKERGEKIAVLTAYDVMMARLLDRAGMDVILVGDSLGMVVLGYDTTLPVTLDMMIHHTKAVSRGVKRALIVADMPFLTYQLSDEEAMRNAGRLIQEGGASAVKIEGGSQIAEVAKRLVDIGVPVMGHLGLTPQSVHQLGGFRQQGRDSQAAEKLIKDAELLEKSGVFSIVLESIPADLAGRVTSILKIPTIGIGAGTQCDGQVLVSNDAFGLTDGPVPPFAKQYAQLSEVILSSARAYIEDVRAGGPHR